MVVRTKPTSTTVTSSTGGNGKDESIKPHPLSSSSWSSSDHDATSSDEPEEKAKIMLFSESGVGKTDFICRNAPDPMIIFDFDGRSLRTIKKVRRETGKTIHHVRILLPGEEDSPEETKLFATESLKKTFRNLKWAVRQSLLGQMSTIGFDGATEFDLLSKLAYDGCKVSTKEGAFGKDKDFVNYQFWRVFNICRQGQAHIILTSREKEIYKDHQSTGDFTFRASKVINEAVDISLQLRAKDQLSGSGKKYEIEVIKAGVDDKKNSKVGKVYKERDWQECGPFALICSDIYGGSIEDWK